VYRAPEARRARNAADVERILETYEPLPITDAVARVHAAIWAQLAAAASSVDAHDLWIGATALAHGFGVATLNRRDFDRIPELRVVGP
jgi:predicted nucleic acid-binding protein